MSITPRRSIVVAGMIAADPYQGGATWAVLQYLLGLRALGHDVLFVEPVPSSKLEPAGCAIEASSNFAYLVESLATVGFDGAYALLDTEDRRTAGLSFASLREWCRRADLLINVSGMLADDELIAQIPVRAYLDLDPAFVQLWHAQGIDMRFDAHTHFVTVGLAIGSASCAIPTDGRTWITTLQPVVVDAWPFAGPAGIGALTTIANWRGYGSIEWQGVSYGQKAHSIRELVDLPHRVDERFVLALAIHPTETRDLAALTEHRWELVDPAAVASTPARYRTFIQDSYAEIGIAKAGYVRSACGWFSDRSVCYLASGRPVIAQDTGFARHLDVGRGLFAFSNADDVATACDALRTDYDRHRRHARALAEEQFRSDRVLGRLIDRLGVG